MTLRQPPRLGVLLTKLLPQSDEPLVGDLIEGHVDRSNGWFWRQVLFAVLLRTIDRVRIPFRHATLEVALTSMAMLAVVGFEAVVAASLLDHLFEQLGFAWVTQSSLQLRRFASFTALSFVLALVVGWLAAGVHRRSRLVVVLACSASATLMALLTLYLSSPGPMRPFLPSAVRQVAAAMVFIIGLLAGFKLPPVRERRLS
jgi:hypothetical protein